MSVSDGSPPEKNELAARDSAGFEWEDIRVPSPPPSEHAHLIPPTSSANTVSTQDNLEWGEIHRRRQWYNSSSRNSVGVVRDFHNLHTHLPNSGAHHVEDKKYLDLETRLLSQYMSCLVTST